MFDFIRVNDSIYCMNRILTLFLFLALFQTSIFGESQKYRFNGVELRFNSASFPEELTSIFYYPESSVDIIGIAGSQKFLSPAEGAILLSTDDTIDKVEAFYIEQINKYGWRVIQSQNGDSSKLIMAESPFMNIVTLILQDSKPTRVKVYFKRSGVE